jgi:hypothetical protein
MNGEACHLAPPESVLLVGGKAVVYIRRNLWSGVVASSPTFSRRLLRRFGIDFNTTCQCHEGVRRKQVGYTSSGADAEGKPLRTLQREVAMERGGEP